MQRKLNKNSFSYFLFFHIFCVAKVFSNFEISYNMILGFKITEDNDGKTRSEGPTKSVWRVTWDPYARYHHGQKTGRQKKKKRDKRTAFFKKTGLWRSGSTEKQAIKLIKTQIKKTKSASVVKIGWQWNISL